MKPIDFTYQPGGNEILNNGHTVQVNYEERSSIIVDGVGLNLKQFHIHDLRHTFASRLIMAGIDLRTIQVLPGHKTINMTLRYAHLAPGHLKKAVDSLNPEKSHNDFHNTPFLSRARK